MKRSWVLVLVVVVAVVISAVVWAAQEPNAPGPQGEQMGMMMGGGRMGPVAIAASGNDVYVAAGGMIMKYNSDLQLMKQVELPTPERGMGGGRGGRGGRGGGGMGRRGAM
jgi:hypothetical protein